MKGTPPGVRPTEEVWKIVMRGQAQERADFGEWLHQVREIQASQGCGMAEAARRLGEMIKKQKETVGLNRGSAGNGPGRGKKAVPQENRLSDDRPTLSQAGIDKKLSMRSQRIASIPEGEQ